MAKSDTTFSALLSTGFKLFNRMGEEKRLSNIGVCNYIQLLANSVHGLDISDWDIVAIFGIGSGNELMPVTKKGDINRRFFEHLSTMRSASRADMPELTLGKSAARGLATAESKRLADLLAKAKENLDRALKEADENYKRFESSTNQATSYATVVSRLTNTGRVDIAGQLDEVNRDGFWEFVDVTADTNVLVVRTRQPIILTYRNPAAGIDLRVPMGYFEARIGLVDSSIRINKAGDNIVLSRTSAGHYHPHLNNSGQPCWGTVSSLVPKLLSEANFTELLRVIQSHLTTYNPANPYAALEHYAEAAGLVSSAAAARMLEESDEGDDLDEVSSDE